MNGKRKTITLCEFCGQQISPSAIDNLTKCHHCGFINRTEQCVD